MPYKYSAEYNKEHMAKAVGRALPISTKVSVMICNSIRNREVSYAKKLLKEVADLKTAIKFTKFTNGAGHKPGIGPGKYPQKAATEILGIIEAVESNAQFKGMNTSSLTISHISAQNAGNQWRYGRHRRRKMKRTNIEIIVKEGEKKKDSKTKPSVEKKQPPKKVEEVKKAAEKTETKEKPKMEDKKANDSKPKEEKATEKPVEKVKQEERKPQSENKVKEEKKPESKPAAEKKADLVPKAVDLAKKQEESKK